MKKILTTILSCLMIVSSASVNVFAETGSKEVETSSDSTTFDATATITKESVKDSGTQNYYVKIEWTMTPGSYTVSGDTYTWNAKEMKYVRDTDGQGELKSTGNTDTTAQITITNQSNADVDYTINYESVKQSNVDISEESSSNNKTGSLQSFIKKNSIDVTSDTEHLGDEEISYSTYTADSATYNGTVKLTSYKSDTYSADKVKLGTYTISIASNVAKPQLKINGVAINTTSTYDASKINLLYEVGETKLTGANDIVTVNGVECYVLSVDETAKTAQLITKNIYDQRFNSESSKGYDYATSDLKIYMDNFYTTQLGSDSRIIDHTVTSYTSSSYNPDFDNYDKSTITQKVYALDAVEANTNKAKFGSRSWENYNAYRDSAYTNRCSGFLVSAGYYDDDSDTQWESCAFSVDYDSFCVVRRVNSTFNGARPAFTITLE